MVLHCRRAECSEGAVHGWIFGRLAVGSQEEETAVVAGSAHFPARGKPRVHSPLEDGAVEHVRTARPDVRLEAGDIVADSVAVAANAAAGVSQRLLQMIIRSLQQCFCWLGRREDHATF